MGDETTIIRGGVAVSETALWFGELDLLTVAYDNARKNVSAELQARGLQQINGSQRVKVIYEVEAE